MKHHYDLQQVESLKKCVLERAAIDGLAAYHCKSLAQQITARTGLFISETTIKRVFGFACYPFAFSLFTLNSLAVFVGYKDWEHYFNTDQAKNCSQPLFAAQCRTYTSAFCRSVLMHAKLSLDRIVIQEAVARQLQSALDGSDWVTPIVGPAQSGKTMSIAWWCNQLPKETALLLINATKLFSFLNSYDSVQQWLTYYLNIPALPGNIPPVTLVIDHFDERSFSREKLKVLYLRLCESCRGNQKFPLKVVIITRPSVWLDLAWDHGLLQLSSVEVLAWQPHDVCMALKKGGVSSTHIAHLGAEIFNLLASPALLNDFCCSYEKDNGEIAKAQKWMLAAVARRLAKVVYENTKKKVLVLLNSKVVKGTHLRYDELPMDTHHLRAISELLDEGIIKEEGQLDLFTNNLAIIYTNELFAAFFMVSLNSVPPQAKNLSLQKWINTWRICKLVNAYSKKLPPTEAFDFLWGCTPAEKIAAMDFLAQLHEPDEYFIHLMNQLNIRHDIVAVFFTHYRYLDYLSFSKAYFLKILITFCRDDKLLHDLLCLLLLNIAASDDHGQLRALHIYERLPVISGEVYTGRAMLISIITDMLLYKIVSDPGPDFMQQFTEHSLALIGEGRLASCQINKLLLKLYYDNSNLISPGSVQTDHKKHADGMLRSA